MHSAHRQLQKGFKDTENDMIIASVLGVIISVILAIGLCYILYFAIGVSLARRGVELMPFDDFVPLFTFLFVVAVVACRYYEPEDNAANRRSVSTLILGFILMVPTFVVNNLQSVWDLFELKSGRYSLDLAMKILESSKKGIEVKKIYTENRSYGKKKTRLTLTLLEKAEFVFINKAKWTVFTTDKGDMVLFEWKHRDE